MNELFSLIPNSIVQQLTIKEVILCNQFTEQYGLSLSEEDATALVKTRKDALEEFGRLEFSGGTISKLIMEFCDSPYLSQFHYTETLNELLEIFYYFKNETLDELSDDDLIAIMKKSFNESCQGSTELMQSRDLENLSRKIRFGITNLENLSEDIEGIFENDIGESPDGARRNDFDDEKEME